MQPAQQKHYRLFSEVMLGTMQSVRGEHNTARLVREQLQHIGLQLHSDTSLHMYLLDATYRVCHPQDCFL